MLHTFAAMARTVIEFISIIIIMGGVAAALFGGCRLLLAMRTGSGVPRDGWTHLRLNFEDTLLLVLQFLMAADIIGTISDPDLQGVIVLSAIVLLRVILSFTISREVAEMDKRERARENAPDLNAAPAPDFRTAKNITDEGKTENEILS